MQLSQITADSVAWSNTDLFSDDSGSQSGHRCAKVKVSVGLHSLRRLSRWNLLACLCQLLDTGCISWLTIFSSSSKLAASGWVLRLPSLWFFHSGSLFHLQGPLPLHWAHTGNPGQSLYFQVSWWATLIPSTVLIPLYQEREHIHGFWRLGHGHIWRVIILLPYSSRSPSSLSALHQSMWYDRLKLPVSISVCPSIL